MLVTEVYRILSFTPVTRGNEELKSGFVSIRVIRGSQFVFLVSSSHEAYAPIGELLQLLRP